MNNNIITAVFGASREVKTNPVWRIDKGMQLRITGLDLPDYYQVHFANQPVQGEAIPVLVSGDTVDIPDQYFQTGEDIYAWIYLTPAEGVGYTIRRVTIPVKARPDISGDEPTPEQESIIDQAIAALNTSVEAAESAAQAAQAAARNVPQAIDAALQEAKDSGEFDGPQGPKGDPGAQGPAGGNITVEETLISGEDYELDLDDNGEDLAGEIAELKSAIGVETLTNWIDGYYITLTGNTVDLSNPMRNTSWRCLYTVCSPGDVFTISGDGGSPRLWGFVDSNYNILSKASANTAANNILITAPENTAYLVLNDKAKNADSYKGMLLQQSLMAALSPIDDALTDANNATSNKIYLIKSPDNVQNLPFVNYPGLLITFANDVAKLQVFMQSSSVLFYRRHWSTSWQSWHQVITIDQLEDATNKPKDNILSAYSNILCIGDSLTYSLVYTGKTSGGDDISRQAYVTYPVALQRKTGVTCSSLGRAGITTAAFWNEFNELITEKENQLAIVYLGTNDGLTDTMDTDMQGDDYTLWSNTSTGCYGKIIAKLLSVGSKVVLVKVYSSSGDIDVTNNVIEAMANKFGIPFIENVRFADMKYHSWPDGTGYNYVHYNDLGYSVFADYLIYQVSNLGTDDMKKILPE